MMVANNNIKMLVVGALLPPAPVDVLTPLPPTNKESSIGRISVELGHHQ